FFRRAVCPAHRQRQRDGAARLLYKCKLQPTQGDGGSKLRFNPVLVSLAVAADAEDCHPSKSVICAEKPAIPVRILKTDVHQTRAIWADKRSFGIPYFGRIVQGFERVFMESARIIAPDDAIAFEPESAFGIDERNANRAHDARHPLGGFLH